MSSPAILHGSPAKLPELCHIVRKTGWVIYDLSRVRQTCLSDLTYLPITDHDFLFIFSRVREAVASYSSVAIGLKHALSVCKIINQNT